MKTKRMLSIVLVIMIAISNVNATNKFESFNISGLEIFINPTQMDECFFHQSNLANLNSNLWKVEEGRIVGIKSGLVIHFPEPTGEKVHIGFFSLRGELIPRKYFLKTMQSLATKDTKKYLGFVKLISAGNAEINRFSIPKGWRITTHQSFRDWITNVDKGNVFISVTMKSPHNTRDFVVTNIIIGTEKIPAYRWEEVLKELEKK